MMKHMSGVPPKCKRMVQMYEAQGYRLAASYVAGAITMKRGTETICIKTDKPFIGVSFKPKA